MIKRKLTIATAAALFFVLAGTGVASALWSTPASVSSTVKVANLADDCSTTAVSMLNASFEDPAQASGVSNVSGNGGLTGWRAKKNSDNSVTSIEVWTSGTQYDNRPPVIAPVGNQFVELNANEAGTLYQDVDTLTAGQMLQWSFLHRGRLGEDTMQLLIGAPGALVLQGQFKTGNNVANGNNGWVRYSGSYIVPANQAKTQLAFKALETASGNTTIGNFLDDVSFGSSPCVKASSVVNNASPSTNQTIKYTTTVTSSGGTPSSATAFVWDIPAGLSYVANSLKVNNSAVASATVTGARIFAGLGVGATNAVGGTLARGTTATVSFEVVVTAPANSTIGYTPTVNYSNGLAATWTRTVIAADVPITVLSAADVAVTASVSAPTVARSKPISWTIVVTNAGPASSTGVIVRVTVPTALSGVTVSGTGMTCVAVSGVAGARDCTVTGALDANTSRTIAVAATTSNTAVSGATYTVSGVARATTVDPATANNTAAASTTVDITAPGAPTSVNASPTRTSITLGWSPPSSGAADVAFYDVYRNGTLVGTVTAPGTGFTDTGLRSGTWYDYDIYSRDAAGNVSAAAGGMARTN